MAGGDLLTTRDGNPGDRAVYLDLFPPRPDAGGSLSFCKGGPYAQVKSETLKVKGTRGHSDYVASCCGPGEVVTLESLFSDGKGVDISFQIARFPNVKLPPKIKIDLAKPPAGWFFAINCNPSSLCGSAHPSDSTFKGWLEIQSLLGAPAVQVSLCVSTTPKAPTNPYKRPMKLWAAKVLVNKACVPGMDQTCNNDPKISSLRGKCQANSTCTCNPGAQKMPNGKCQ